MDPFGLKKRKKELEDTFEEKQNELEEKRSVLEEKQAEAEKKLLEYSEKLEDLRKEENELKAREEALELQKDELEKRAAELDSLQKDLADKSASLAKEEEKATQRSVELDARVVELDHQGKSLEEKATQLEESENALNQLREAIEAKEIDLNTREANLAQNNKAGEVENEGPSKPQTPPEELNPLLENVDTSTPNELNQKKVDEYKGIIQLPNGMVGKKYSLELSELKLDEDIVVDQIIGLEDFDLYYDKLLAEIAGTPSKDGEATFEMIYHMESAGPAEFRDKKVRILINPDPRSLWKNLEPPADGLYFKENEDHAQLEFGPFRAVAASKRGRSHAHAGTFRDDDFTMRSLDSGWLFAAVADGAGSAEYSREGSKIACEKSSEIVASMLEENSSKLEDIINQHIENPNSGDIKQALTTELYQIFGQGVMSARNGIIEKAKENDHQVRDYSTTLIFTIMKPFEQGYFIASYAVGDGAVAIHKEGERVKLLMEPDGGEYAGQTRFLTMAEVMESTDIWKRIRFDYSTDFNSVLLLTDGVSDPKFQTDANLHKTEMWDALMADIKKEVDFSSEECGPQLVNWLDFWSQGNHDDRTIAVITKK